MAATSAGDVEMQDTTSVAADDEMPPAQPQEPPDDAANDSSSDDDDDDDSASSDDEPPVESLVAGRARRTNAGNLMARALAAEDDGDTDLLFVEEGEDDDFEAAPDPEAAVDDEEDDSSSSSDDEDNQAQDDDLIGEKELRKQERAEQRATKRKPIGPQPIRKRVKIADPTKPDAPAKRPKKSERVSWLPSEGDAPTRVSSRKLAVENKVRTLENLKESGIRSAGLRQKMEITNAKRKALERPPMTQEERLQEAARTEKLNLKSVKRWEQQESDRQARQQAELERLRNKKLEGPVIRWYSGPCEWDYKDRLHRIGRPPKVEVLDVDIKSEAPADNDTQLTLKTTPGPVTKSGANLEANTDTSVATGPPSSLESRAPPDPSDQLQPATDSTSGDVLQKEEVVASENLPESSADALNEGEITTQQDRPTAEIAKDSSVPPTAPEPIVPEAADANTEPITGSTDADFVENPESNDMDNSNTANTQTATQSATEVTESVKPEGSNASFLEGIEEYASLPPETSLSVTTAPQDAAATAPQDAAAGTSAQPAAQTPNSAVASSNEATVATSNEPNLAASNAIPADSTPAAADKPSPPPKPSIPKPPPRAGQAQTLTLLSFDATVLAKQPESIRRILLKSQIPNPSSSTSRSASAIHLAALRPVQPHCAITNQPAKYRDPLTGLAYRDMEAFRVLRDTVDGCLFREDQENDGSASALAVAGGVIAKGRYGPRWSTLLGAWVGREGVSARNVPAGFVHGTVAVPLPSPTPVPGSGSTSASVAGVGAVPGASAAPSAGAVASTVAGAATGTGASAGAGTVDATTAGVKTE